MEKHTVIDLFCGAGGLSVGFQMAGFQVIAANDIWKSAIETYKANHNDPNVEVILGDASQAEIRSRIVRIGKSNKVDAIIGGPPCQDFSSAGHRTGEGERANMTPLFAEIVKEILPTWVIMENVNTILSIGEKQFRKAEEMLHDAGYGITITVLNAMDFGAPQDRKRMFLVARLGGKDNELLKHLQDGRKKPVTVREFMPEIAQGVNATEFYYRHPWTYERRAIFSIDEVSPTIRGVSRPMPDTYKFHSNDAVKDKTKIRPLTMAERARIQSFPKDYVWVGNKTQVEQQIGNAVPPLLAKHVADVILNYQKSSLLSYLKVE